LAQYRQIIQQNNKRIDNLQVGTQFPCRNPSAGGFDDKKMRQDAFSPQNPAFHDKSPIFPPETYRAAIRPAPKQKPPFGGSYFMGYYSTRHRTNIY
jgi:hypothetical protein